MKDYPDVPKHYGKWQIINTWNGGKKGRVVEFVSSKLGDEGHNECFKWFHKNTPFSFSTAVMHQGYAVEPVEE